MIRRIVVDSSADLACEATDTLRSVPLKILQGAREYVDDASLDVAAMLDEIAHSRERTSSSCPNIYDWLTAFEGADEVFAVAISSHMSGSYASAVQAAADFAEKHPDARIRVIDSRNAGPGVTMQVEQLQALCATERTFDEISADFDAYQPHVHLVFGMESVSNFVKNGRLNPAVAAVAGVLGLRFINRASAEGKFEQLHKCRGSARMLSALIDEMGKLDYASGKVIIGHAQNPSGAMTIRDRLLIAHPHAQVAIREMRGLCSYYAEKGGILIGFEDQTTPVQA